MLSYQYRMDESTAPTEAQMKLAIAQTLSMPFAYNAPVVVLNFDVDEEGGITGNFKDAARPRVFSFELDGESVSYSPYKQGKMDSLESEDDVIEWEEFSAGCSYRVDAGIGAKSGKKPQCVKPTSYNCGKACINVQKDCRSNAKDSVSRDRLKKLNTLAKSYLKEHGQKFKKGDEGAKKSLDNYFKTQGKVNELTKSKNETPSVDNKVKKVAKTKSSTKKTAEPEVKTEPKVEQKTEAKSTSKSKANPFYSDEPIKDYETFKKEIPKELARINFENNYDSLIPIHKVREELKGRVSDKDFDKWMADSQGDNDNIRLQTGNPNNPLPGGINTGVGATREYIGFSDNDAKKRAEVEIKRTPGQIVDPKEFKALVDDVYDKLNKEKAYDDLVPIYQLRRAMGDKVSRGDFNNLMAKMQEDDNYQLMGGSVENSAKDKIQDSVSSSLVGLRTYAKKLK